MAAPRNKLEQSKKQQQQEMGQPPNSGDRISYGIIAEVNNETSQVKVRGFKADGTPGELVSKGFLPLLNSLLDVHHRFGALREGMVVRMYWKGKNGPGSSTIVEVIGDEEHNLLKKLPTKNELIIGPYRIFSGGLGV